MNNDKTDGVSEARPSEKILRLFPAGVALSAVLGIAGAVVYCFAYALSYEKEIMHYKTGSPLIVVAGALIALSAAVALALGIASRGTGAARQVRMEHEGSAFFPLLTGLLFIGYAVSVIISSRGFPGTRLEVLALLASFPSAAAMILRATRYGSRAVGQIASLFPILFSGLLIFVYYFDFTTAPINSPEKGLTNVMLSVAIVFFISDSRDRIDRVSPVLAVFSRTVAAFILGPLSVARIVLRLTSGLEHPAFIVNALTLSVALYAGYLLVLTNRILPEAPPVPERNDKTNKTDNDPVISGKDE